MRNYECVYILVPTLDESAIKEKKSRFDEIVTSRGGTVGTVNEWGKRKLAYPIKKFQEGYYIVSKFTGNNDILDELNRVFRFDDQVIRHMIVIDDNPEPVKAEE